VALRWGSGRAETPGYVSIDPNKDDPKSSFMSVVASESIASTRFAWTAFEADRLMKSLSVGFDGVTQEPMIAKVPGFLNLSQRIAMHEPRPKEVWSRLWLKPGPNRQVADVRAMRIERSTVLIDTEIMYWQGGRLVSSSGARDPAAQDFAAFFNANYALIAAQVPVFARFEQLVRLMWVAEWSRSNRLPLDWASIEQEAGDDYPIAAVTRGLVGETTVPMSGGSRTISVFGGATFESLEPSLTKKDLRPFEDAVRKAARAGSQRVLIAGQSYVILTAIASSPAEPVHVLKTLVSEVLPGGKRWTLYGRAPSGAERELYVAGEQLLAFPRLLGSNPQPATRMVGTTAQTGGWERQVQRIGVAGAGSRVLVPRLSYQLTAADGRRLGTFPADKLSVVGDHLVVRSIESQSEWVLRPQREDWVIASKTPEHSWFFDPRSGWLIGEQLGSDLVTYHYNRHGVLSEIKTGGDHGTDKLLLRGEHAEGGRRLLRLVRADGRAAAELLHRPGMSGSRKPAISVPYDAAGVTYPLTLDLATGTWSSASPTKQVEGILSLLDRRGLALARALASSASGPRELAVGAFTLALSADRTRLAILDARIEDRARVTLLKGREPGFRSPDPLAPKLREGPPSRPEREQLERLRALLLRTASRSPIGTEALF
jgi:hypothetical protein